jgi:MoxR-like ATPase
MVHIMIGIRFAEMGFIMAGQTEVLRQEINKVIKGKSKVVDKVLCAMLAGGHILLEDIPGVGKTTLAMTIAKAMALSYRRVQFTPDVLPSDIVGFSMFNSQTKEFEYREGAIFANLFLADEINRTSPKTQSALLEAMEEEKVTVDGVEHRLPTPFTVIATENPVGSSGTQMLPESQLDRFMVCLSMGYPEHEDAVSILKNDGAKPLRDVREIISIEEWGELKQSAEHCFVSDALYDYVVRLTEATRESRYLSLGASPRASIALLRMAKAMAVLCGRDYVIPEDIKEVYYDVFAHRVRMDTMAKAEGMTVIEVLVQVFEHEKI